MENDCIFCKIINGQIKTKVVYEDDKVLAFEDIKPQAPVHILIIPKQHIGKLSDLKIEDKDLIAELILAANETARQKGISEDGYRLVLNCGENAGQLVFHIHLHLLGGRKMSWPPG